MIGNQSTDCQSFNHFFCSSSHRCLNFQVNEQINSLTRGNKFLIHYSMNTKKDNDHCLHIRSHLSCFFFWSWRVRVFEASSRSLTGLTLAWFLGHNHNAYSNHLLWLYWKSFYRFQSLFSFHKFSQLLFWSSLRRQEPDLVATHLICKSLVKICWLDPQLPPIFWNFVNHENEAIRSSLIFLANLFYGFII